jgi:hypothetical protein
MLTPAAVSACSTCACSGRYARSNSKSWKTPGISNALNHSVLDFASAAAARASLAGTGLERIRQAWRRRAAVLIDCVVSTAKARWHGAESEERESVCVG